MTKDEQDRAPIPGEDDLAHDLEQGKSPQSSAMVIVLGMVAVLSMTIGFILGKLF